MTVCICRALSLRNALSVTLGCLLAFSALSAKGDLYLVSIGGEPLTGWSYPMHTSTDDSRTQVIYLASDIGMGGRIMSLALKVSSSWPSQTMQNWTIRMKHTTKSVYSTYALESSGWTVVYQGNEAAGITGWRTFNFTTPFDYNGVDNLMVDFSHNNASPGTADGQCIYFNPIGGGIRTVYASSNSTNGDPLTWPGSTPPTVFGSTHVPCVRLEVGVVPPGQAYNPQPANGQLDCLPSATLFWNASLMQINFDDTVEPDLFGNTVRLTDKYAELGVRFEGPSGNNGGAILRDVGGFGVSGYSAPNGLAFSTSGSALLSDGGHPVGPETIRFSPAVSEVGVWAGSLDVGYTLTLQAYDAAGTLLDSDTLALGTTLARIGVTGTSIARVVLSSTAYDFVVDNLEYVPQSGLPTTYDVYLWKDGQARPGTATAAGLTSKLYDPPADLDSGTRYNWQVLAKNVCGQTWGPQWTFTVAPADIEGWLTLKDFSSNAGTLAQHPVTLKLRQGSSIVRQETLVLTNNPVHFVIANVPRGTYELLIERFPHWLREVVPGVAVDYQGGNAGSVVLTNGDCDGSNGINAADLAILTAAMDSQPASDARADLDGSGAVDSTDMSILLANMDLIGDN